VSGVVGIAFLVLEGLGWAQPGAEVTEEAAAPMPPPTRATFISTSAEQWDVTIDGQPVCSTPCTFPLFPLQFVTLRSQERRPVLLDVGRLPPGDLIVAGKPLQNGMYAGGIVATTLGGMAMVVGITLTAVGAARDRSGMTTAGLISGAAGLVAIPGGIHLMMRAVPGVSVGSTLPQPSGATAGVSARF
jgi:hypothetical protein